MSLREIWSGRRGKRTGAASPTSRSGTGRAGSGPVVQMTGICMDFPGGRALDEVSLTLHAGEVHALMGGNGAGKSTLIKVLTGVHAAADGQIVVEGRSRTFSGPADAESAGVTAAYQETFLCTNLSIGENVMLGHEIRGLLGIDWVRTRQRAGSVLAELGIDDLDPRLPLSGLSPASQQLVSIARAMVSAPRVLVLDEPTSSLEAGETARLFQVLDRLRSQGVAIVFVSHFLEQVYTISDRMTVLRDGRVVGEFLTRQVERAELISTMMGSSLQALQEIGSQRRDHRVEPSDQPWYRAIAVAQQGALEEVDLEIYGGEVVGLAGLRGSGRSTLGRLLSGASRSDSGTVEIGGQAIRLHSPAHGLAHRLAFAGERRRHAGLIEELTVRQNVLLALQAMRGWRTPVARGEVDALLGHLLERLDLDAGAADATVGELSGGNQQKVLLARWLAIRPRLLVLDEPTRSMDVAAKVHVQAQVAALAREGVSVVFISSELDEVVRLSDRIVVLKDREVIGEISNGPGLSVDTIVEMIAADRDEF
ncbi:sugar ABC transporter ATP-binding protein [Ruania albidiflava]|uniref:sugar ABC transporter ATP-binding protein n=1 Tax=Ruania albidiflava TaxID=366586 RepID=UPI0023F561B8|nr:sugar ABC transporter ATP-binding protein [Ruania albidiflava]